MTSLCPVWPDSEEDTAIKTSNHVLLYMSVDMKPPPQTKEQNAAADQRCSPINTEDVTAVSRARRMTSRPKRMSLFIASFIRPPATSVTSRQTGFYSRLVDFSAAINSADPRRPRLRGPRWLWRKAAGTSGPARWTLKAAVGSSRRIIACESTSGIARVDLMFGDPTRDDDTLVHQPQDPETPAAFRYQSHKEASRCLFELRCYL